MKKVNLPQRKIIVGSARRAGAIYVCHALEVLARHAHLPYVFTTQQDKPRQVGANPVLHISKRYKPRNVAAKHTIIAVDRNLFDTLTSLQQASNRTEKQLRTPAREREVNNMVKLSDAWAARADILIRFEDMLCDTTAMVSALAASVFPTKTFDLDVVVEELQQAARASNTELTLNDWQNTLDPAIVEYVRKHHAGWFKQHGYTLPNSENGTPDV